LNAGMETALALPNSPLAAYRHAAQTAKIDFLALTDHVHGGAASGEGEDSMPEGAYAITLAAADRVNNDPEFAGKFLAIPGMEWSSISSGNHVNLLFARRETPHTAARTGVWMNELTPAGFAEAFQARRVFATEDNEMSVLFLAGSRWMGETVSLEGAPSRLETFTVRVEQLPDTDAGGSPQDEGPYTVELLGDEDGAGGEPARPVQVRVGNVSRNRFEVRQGDTVTFTRRVRPRAYYYLHVKEGNGKDSGGEKADAWTAPVFFSP